MTSAKAKGKGRAIEEEPEGIYTVLKIHSFNITQKTI